MTNGLTREQLLAENQRLTEALQTAQADVQRLAGEKREQLQMLAEIRRLADAATGIDRTRGDEREPGAIGAVKRLTEALQTARADARRAEDAALQLSYERDELKAALRAAGEGKER